MTVFFEELLIPKVTGFSDLHSKLTQSTHAIELPPTWYRYGLAAPSPKNPTSLSALPPTFYGDICPWNE